MKIFAVCLLFLVFGSLVYAGDPMAVDWDLKNGTDTNTTCFMAHMGIQVHVMYMKNGSKTAAAEATFAFEDSSMAVASICSESSVEVAFMAADDQVLCLTFEMMNGSYSLESAKLTYNVSETTFPNATDSDMGKMVIANSTFSSLLMTSQNMSYNCTMETQFRMTGNDTNDSDIYVRLTPGNTSLMLQAFDISNATYSGAAKCFYDQPAEEAIVVQYGVPDEKNETCALLTTLLELNVNYTTISGKRMSTFIPVTKSVAGVGHCKTDSTDATLMLDHDAGNVTMVFKKVKSIYYRASHGKFALDTLTLDYNPDSPYFMNHESMGMMVSVMVTESGLDEFVTPVGNSYKCAAAAYVDVNGTMTAMFNSTHFQPFEVKNNTFAPATDCQAMETTTQSTPMTTKPILPDDVPPIVSDRVIKNSDNMTCLHADIGIQMRTQYNTTNNATAEAGFNFDANETKQTGECNETHAVITFVRDGDFDQTLKLTFTKDSSGKSYLSAVDYEYTITPHFVNASNINKTEKFMVDSLMEMESSKGKSYTCNSTETDVLVDEDNHVILRITGLTVEPFPPNKTFSPNEKCFSDMPVPKVQTGRWFINDTTKNDTICARFAFAASVNMSYMMLNGKEREVVIPMDAMKYNATDSFGKCGDNKTQLMIPMDDMKINFTFTFEKNFTKKGNSDDYEYMMTSVSVEYSTMSKYFPNHDYVKNNMNTLGNDSLSLFSTDEDHSYKCAAKTTASFNDTENMITFTEVQVQPFGVKDDGSFLSAIDCAADDDLSPLIPIIVGAVLAGLVVIVLIAYVIGRRRNSGPGYESI